MPHIKRKKDPSIYDMYIEETKGYLKKYPNLRILMQEVLNDLPSEVRPFFVYAIASTREMDDVHGVNPWLFAPAVAKEKYVVFDELFLREGDPEYVRWVIVHEVGHRYFTAHYRDIGEFMEIEEGIEGAPTQHARQYGDFQYRREDFADSFAMYLYQPKLLQLKAPLRYQFFVDRFGKPMKGVEYGPFEEEQVPWQMISPLLELGYTDEQIRSMSIQQARQIIESKVQPLLSSKPRHIGHK